MLPLSGLPSLWQTTVISPVWKQKGAPPDPEINWGFSILHPLGKLLALSYLYLLDAEMHRPGWLAEDQAGFCLRYYMEDP